MKAYAVFEFYEESYLLGMEEKIPEKEFLYWSSRSTAEIKICTFGRIEELDQIPEEVSMCCCEVAERLYQFETAKGDNGMVMQSYGNDGDTGTYKTDDMSESAVQKSITSIIRKWLASTGLMYCGV